MKKRLNFYEKRKYNKKERQVNKHNKDTKTLLERNIIIHSFRV